MNLRFQLHEMDLHVFRRLVDHEAATTIPLMEAVGLFINRDILEQDILKIPDQTVLAVFGKDEEIHASLRFSRQQDSLLIRSIALKPGAPVGSLRRLLHSAHELLLKENLEVRSVIQHSNRSAIRFHELFGFQRMKENTMAIQFRADHADLAARLGKRLGPGRGGPGASETR